jgi:D-alanine-D-alanine ligase
MGVSVKSIVKTEAELREQLDYLINRYKQSALVERYVAGREVTVGLVGNITGVTARRLPSRFRISSKRDFSEAGLAVLKAGGMTFLPPMEVDLAPYLETDGVYSNRLKTELADQIGYLCPAPLTPDQVRELNWLTAAAFRVIGCNDVSRVDFRLDENDNDRPYILEINPLPGLAPGISDLVIEANAIGVGHTELVNMILEAAIMRHGLKTGRTVAAP